MSRLDGLGARVQKITNDLEEVLTLLIDEVDDLQGQVVDLEAQVTNLEADLEGAKQS